MNNALPMNHDLDLGLRDIEEPAGFNHFKSLVHQRGGVDRDFRAHFPIRVLERPLRCDILQLFRAQIPEGPSGCRQDQTADIFFAVAF